MKENLASRPLDFYFFSPWVPGRVEKQRRADGRNPAWGRTGGMGEVGEKLHGVERNSGMGSVGARDGRSGGSAKSSGRRRRFAAAAAVHWLGAMASGSGSTGGGQGS